MDFGQIIKRAWSITWRYRFLWILGLFAGVTGAGGGGGGTGGSGGRSFNTGSGTGSGSSSPFSGMSPDKVGSTALHWLPMIIGVVLLLFVVWIVVWALSLAAKGGLIWAVNEIEDGRTPTLGSAWGKGFGWMWRILGLSIIVALPMLAVLILFALIIIVPLVLAFTKGGTAAAAAVVPICGGLIVFIPVVLVLSFVLGIVYVIGERRIVLDGEGVFASARDGWRTLRARFKDTGLMWLINWGLNIAAGIVVAIPIIVLTLVFILPAVLAGVGGHWGMAAVFGIVWFVLVSIFSCAYTAIWGTFTSALWTILYRRLTGRDIPAAIPGYMPPAWASAAPVVAPSAPSGEPFAYAPPMAATPPAGAPAAAPVPPSAPVEPAPSAPAAPAAPPSAFQPPPPPVPPRMPESPVAGPDA